MDVYDLFSKFELDLLPRDWVMNLWKDDFSEAVEFPTEYDMFLENTDISELMTVASKFIKEWLESDSADDTMAASRPSTSRSSINTSHVDAKSWQNLISNNVPHKAIVAMVSIFILRGKTEKSFDEKKLGLIATDFYLMLLAIPGSQVFHIFNPILYSHAIENFKISSVLNSTSGNSKPAKKKRGKRNNDDEEDEDDEPRNDSDNEGDLVPSEKSCVVKMLSNILSDLSFMLKRFHLKGQDDSLLLTIQILILLTRLERSSSSLLIQSPAPHHPSYLSYKSYKILIEIGNPDHGEVSETVKFIMRELMSGLLIFDQKGLKLTPKEALVIKDHSVQFIRHLLWNLQETAYQGVYILMQHICVKIPDKADLRAKGVQVIMEMLNVLPYPLYTKTVVWIMCLCHNEQVKNRILGLEVITKLLYENERIPSSPLRPFPQPTSNRVTNGDANGHANGEGGEEDDEDNGIELTQQPDFSTHKYLLGTIFSRCQDVASSVRAKALAILANLISSNNRHVHHEMESIFVTPYLHVRSIEDSNVYEKSFFDFHNFLKNIRKETNSGVDPLPGARAIINLLEFFIQDEKVFVRKNALQVLSNIFLMSEKWMTNNLLQLMVDNCRDMSVSVRKMLVQCLTDLLLHYPSHARLPHYWVKGILPLLADQEIKSQEKVIENLESVVLSNLVAYDKMKTSHHALPWKIMDLIAEQNKTQIFLYACHKWTLSNSLKQSLITVLKTHIGTENNSATWFLMASFSEYLDIKDPQFVLEYFYENVLDSQQVDEYCCQLVTEVMHLSWRQLSDLAQIQLCDRLLKLLAQFMVPLPMIARCVDMCQLITEAHADSPDEARGIIIEWATNLINLCEHQLEKVIGVDSPEVVEDETRLCQYIFTLGDTALICPAQLQHSALLLVQNLLELDISDDDDDEKRWRGKVSASVQAVAVVTLGKLCLQKEHTAKVLVPLFANLLSDTPHPEIKINAMIALTDMCVKFTSVVEKNLPEMCMCLRDKDVEVRLNTLSLMIQLIQEDYLKLRCPMFFHLLTTLTDAEAHIRDLTSSFIINSLLTKQKNILSQHFVESLFHFNAYVGHATYNKVGLLSPQERAVFSLEGPDRQDQRRFIYRFMLEHMMDDHRLIATQHLCNYVLAGVADEEIELSASGTTLLQDALYSLSCDEIRLSHLRSNKEGEEDEEEPAAANAAFNTLGRKILASTVMRAHMMENIVPIFIKLKHKLKQLKSPLVKDLMASLRDLMKDYKTEINDMLADDKELAAEIAHDLKILDGGEEEEENGGINGDVIQQVVMDVVALNEARRSLNVSKQPETPTKRTKRLSICSQVSSVSNKSSGQKTPTKNRSRNSFSPNKSVNQLRISLQENQNGATDLSNVSSQENQNGGVVSPHRSFSQPTSQTSTCSAKSSGSRVSLESIPESLYNKLAPSTSSSQSDTSHPPNETGEGRESRLSTSRSRRSSTSSLSSQASSKSQNKKTSRRKKR